MKTSLVKHQPSPGNKSLAPALQECLSHRLTPEAVSLQSPSPGLTPSLLLGRGRVSGAHTCCSGAWPPEPERAPVPAKHLPVHPGLWGNLSAGQQESCPRGGEKASASTLERIIGIQHCPPLSAPCRPLILPVTSHPPSWDVPLSPHCYLSLLLPRTV